MTHLPRRILLASGAALATVLGSSAAYAEVHRFHVASQDAVVAIPEFARQANVQIIAPSDRLHGVKTPAIDGPYEVRAGLTLLLQKTGLSIASDDGRVITLAQQQQQQQAPPATQPPPAERAPVPSRDSGGERSSNQLAEVVVTALRREQRLQEVPLAVTALSSDALQSRRVNSSDDLAQALPGLVNVSNQTSGSFAIRGQGPSFGSAPGAYVYFAEVPMLSIPTNTEPSGIDSRPGTFFDMADVELLKGPQGTLFGRNATGGNILFTPRRPVDRVEGYIQGQVGNYSDRAVEGAVNFPLMGGKLLVRAGGALETRDGYVTDVGPLHVGKDYDNLNYGTARLSVIYAPTDNVEEYLIARYYKNHDNGPSFVEAAITPGTPAALNTLFPSRIPYFNEQMAIGPRHVAYDANTFDHLEYWQAINTLTYRFNDDLRLKNILSYANSAESLGMDVDGSPNPILNQTNAFRKTPNAEIMTGELQVSGDALNKHLDFAFGGYADRGYIIHRTYDFAFYPFVPGNGALGQPPVGVPAAPGYPLYLDLNGETRSKAVYGQSTFNFGYLTPALEGLKLTGGYRYTWEDGHAFQKLIFSAGPSGTPGAWSNSYGSYNATLDYQLSRSTLFYASVKDAYKSGGVNVQLSPTDPDRFYLPEHLVSKELGAKTQGSWGEVAASVDVAAFWSDYENIQRSIVDTNRAVAAFTTNVARAHINGVEVNASLKFWSRVQVTENYAFTDSGYDRITNPNAVAILTGANLPFVARQKSSTSVTVDVLKDNPLGDLSVGASYSYQDRTSATQTNTAGLLGPWYPSVSLWTVSANWKQANGGPFSARLFVNNAANALYRIGTYDFSTTMGFVSNRYGQPRMIGFQLRYGF